MNLFRSKIFSIFIGLLIVFSFSWPAMAEQGEQQLVHVVLLWLKEPGNAEHRQQFMNACRKFNVIPGVLDMRIGEPVESDRAVVDDSFDVGLYVTVADKQALETYLNHPIHVEAVNSVLKPIADKIIVYDFVDQASQVVLNDSSI
jgi:Stress responsive A/B Barrel Domain